MESLVVLLTVDDHPVLDQNTRALLRSNKAFTALQPERAEQAWGGAVPGYIHFIAQAQGTAIFIKEDWVTTIQGRRLLDCVGGICAVINAIRQEFGMPVMVELSDSHYSNGDSLYLQLDRERARRRYRAIGLWFLTILASGMAGALIQWIIGGGS